MRKNKTFSNVSFIIIILSLILGVGSKVNAERGNTATGQIRVEKQALTSEREIQREENRNKIQNLKDQSKTMIQVIIDNAKQERTELKSKVQTVKEEVQTTTEEIKAKLKKESNAIKNEAKKISTEKIIDSINNLNAKLTEQLLDKTSQIENVVLGIESRIIKGEEKGLDVSKVKETLSHAKLKINTSKDTILSQKAKTYTVAVTDEATLKSKIKEIRDGFKKDITATRKTVVDAHTAVKNVAVALANIQDIDDEETTTKTDATTTE